jgi:hypothetical protein
MTITTQEASPRHWELKSCPHCKGGDLYLREDDSRLYYVCIQCSYEIPSKRLRELFPVQIGRGEAL